MYYEYIKTGVIIYILNMLLCLHISGTWISILTVVQYQALGRRHSQDTQSIGGP